MLGDYYSRVIKGDKAETYKAIAPQVDFAKTQFANARRTVNQSVPAGGAAPAAHANLAATEAQTISSMFRDKIQDALEKLQQLAEFNTSGGMTANTGVATTGSQLGQLANQRLGAWMSGLGGISGALGTYFGMKAGG